MVIAIIGVLAGMTMPALSYARAAGQRTNCLNNKANVLKAMQIYANKNNDMIPFKLEGASYAYVLIGEAYTQVNGASRPNNWKYTSNYLQPALLTCTVSNVSYNDANDATNNAFGMLNVAADTWTGTWKGVTGNPTIRKQFGRFVVGTGDNISYLMGRVKNASILPLFTDSFKEMAEGESKPTPLANFKLWDAAGDNEGMPAMVHNDQTTVGYADGSARAASARALANDSGLRYTLNAELDTIYANGTAQ